MQVTDLNILIEIFFSVLITIGFILMYLSMIYSLITFRQSLNVSKTYYFLKKKETRFDIEGYYNKKKYLKIFYYVNISNNNVFIWKKDDNSVCLLNGEWVFNHKILILNPYLFFWHRKLIKLIKKKFYVHEVLYNLYNY